MARVVTNSKSPEIEEHLLDHAPSTKWSTPSPLVATIATEPYPLDALPDTIRAAVEEVRDFTKAPISMVASSALATLSLAAQAHYDVQRADKLTGPVGLFFLTVADSGERKSTCDSFFSAPIKEYDQEQAERAKPELARHAASHAAWSAEREGILGAIKQATKSGKPVGVLQEKLQVFEECKPSPPRVPKLMRGEDTPENLAYVLAREFPSTGVITAEGGMVLGSHGMGKDSIMRNLAL